MNKKLNSIIDFCYKHKKNPKIIPIIGLAVISIIVFIMGSKDVLFLMELYDILNISHNVFSESVDTSNQLVLLRNVIIIITILTGYRYWIRDIKIVETNSGLVKIIIGLVIFLFATEHISNSSVDYFVDLAIYSALVILILAVLIIFLKGIYFWALFAKSKQSARDYDFSEYASESPLTDSALDEFERCHFAQRVAQTIASHREKDSIVIGIYGDWGAGKSTILNFINHELQIQDDILCVKFNPWLFKDDIHLLQNFFQTIANKLGRSLSSPNDKIREWLKDCSAYLSITIGGIQLSPGKVGTDTASIEIDELKARIGEVLKDEGKRIVIFVDDIDRLDKSEIQTTFKLIKLLASFDYTTYVLAFDDKMVSEALGEKYQSEDYNNLGNKESGKSFIEKIVQVPLIMPKADLISLRKFGIGHVLDALKQAQIDLNEEQYEKFVDLFIIGIEPRLQTPRMAIRYGNALRFSLPLLKGEVNNIDLILIEGIRIFYPTLYDHIRKKPHIFLGSVKSTSDYEINKNHKDELLDKVLEGLDNDEKESAEKLLEELFPRFNRSLLDLIILPHFDEKMIKEQRIGSHQYFDRYFSYTVLKEDISDIEIENFIEFVERDTIPDIVDKIRKIMADRSADLFVLKLRKKTKSLSQNSSCNLAIAIAEVADFILHSEIRVYSYPTTAFNQTLLLVNQLVTNIPKENQFSVSEDIITKGSIVFASGFFKLIKTTEEIIERDIIVTVENKNELGAILKERIEHLSENKDIYRQYPRNAAIFFNIWSIYGSKKETNQYIAKTFDDNPHNAIELLKCYTTTWYSGKHQHKGDFEPKDYASITKVVDADIIYDALNKIYESNIKKLKDHENGSLSEEDKIVDQFVQIYDSKHIRIL